MTATLTPIHTTAPRPRSIFRKTPFQKKRPGCRFLVLLPFMVGVAAADVSGNFNYTENPDNVSVTISSCVTPPTGALVIPATIIVPGDPDVEKTVTRIGSLAFYNYSGVTSVTVPEGVTEIQSNAFYNCLAVESISLPSSLATIGTYVFYNCYALPTLEIPENVQSIGNDAFVNCISLQEITVNALNLTYSSVGGVLFNKDKNMLIAYPSGVDGGYVIPDGVETIGIDAFNNCDKLTSLTVPASVTGFGNGAFYSCGSLAAINFLGNTPTLGSYSLIGLAPTFTVFRFSLAEGFDVSPWSNYSQVLMGAPTPTTDWLLSLGLPYNSDMLSDSNHDGVSLLMAYALNLDPNQNLSGSLPQPVFGASQMSLSYYAGTVGVTYAVETCTTLDDWTTAGVSLSVPDTNGIVTAVVDLTGPSRYMRLKVSD